MDKLFKTRQHKTMPATNKNKKSLVCLALSLIGIAVINVTFTNCGGVGSVQSSTVTSQMSYESTVTALKTLHAGRVPASFCQDSKNYACLYKVFSTRVVNNSSSAPEAICTAVSDRTEICATTQKFVYSTFNAEKSCRENCDEAARHMYDYEEFECHVKLSLNADGIYPLVASEKNFVDSMEKVYQSCLEIQKGSARE